MSNESSVKPEGADAQQQSTERERTIARLRAFADWLEANPEIPAPQLHGEQYSLVDQDGDEEKIAEAKRIAALLGIEVEPKDGRISFNYQVPGGTLYTVHGFLAEGSVRYAEQQAAAEAVRRAREEKAAEPARFDADEPRVWRWENEADRAEPVGVAEVTTPFGVTWIRANPGWRTHVLAHVSGYQSWSDLLDYASELTEVVAPAQDGAR